MEQPCWSVWADRGFLSRPDPLVSLLAAPPESLMSQQATVEAVEQTAARLPELLRSPALARRTLADLPMLTGLEHVSLTPLEMERLFQLYTFLASAFVHASVDQPAAYLPKTIAVPLVAVADRLERPPILSYASFVLANWQRLDPYGAIAVENLRTLQTFTGTPDESWFALIHVEVEARAAEALCGAENAARGVVMEDAQWVESGLSGIYRGLRAMTKTFRRMRLGCDPDIYYHQVRPYNFGFINVVYEGTRLAGTPQNFRGGSGAQSTVIPALVAALGIEHEATDLIVHLKAMRPYMPRPHRELIDRMSGAGIRAFVQRSAARPLRELYNDCLRAVTGFRQLHLNYAKLYIFERGGASGTGGTPFMDWLKKLIDETEAQYL